MVGHLVSMFDDIDDRLLKQISYRELLMALRGKLALCFKDTLKKFSHILLGNHHFKQVCLETISEGGRAPVSKQAKQSEHAEKRTATKTRSESG
ncbi:hypothetical protein ElyMa_003203600 [Elysia marginata]|uniref:Uncharacterized protein n=1 Tax=Elysia marginata TaxID=1093978 RepID=A0AAV4J3L0_9GAST|nr:hypothetical protein ElyMa_003203600 [Elysia marginata]